MGQITTWTVVQSLSRKKVIELIYYGFSVVSQMRGNPEKGGNKYFQLPNPIPENPTLEELEASLGKLQKANILPYGKVRTGKVKAEKQKVLRLLKAIGNYVEIVANINENSGFGDAIIISANMKFKKAGGNKKVEDLTVKNHPVQKNWINARDKRFKKGTIYMWMVRQKGTEIWITVKKSTGAKHTFKNLDRTIMHEFQVERSFSNGSISMSKIAKLPGT